MKVSSLLDVIEAQSIPIIEYSLVSSSHEYLHIRQSI